MDYSRKRFEDTVTELRDKGRIWTTSLGAVRYRINGGRTCLGKSSEKHRLAARHSLLNANGTGSLSLVCRTVNQKGLSPNWNSLVFFVVD